MTLVTYFINSSITGTATFGFRTGRLVSTFGRYIRCGDKPYKIGDTEYTGSVVLRKDDPRGLKVIQILAEQEKGRATCKGI